MGRVVLLAVLVAAVAVACGGDKASTPAPSAGVAEATRDLVNGLPGVTSTIEVRFNRPITLVSDDVPLASHFELDAPRFTTSGVKTDRVLVKSATQDEEDSRLVTLKVDRLIPAGATIRVPKDAFERDARGSIEINVDSDLDVLAALLAGTALAVGDPSLLNAGDPPPVTDADRDPVVQRQALEEFTRKRGGDDAAVAETLARFDAIPASIVESPKLRAALAALTGTFAEAAIDSIVTANNCTNRPAAKVLFQVPPELPNLFARVTYAADGARVISFNPAIEGEPFQMLMPLMLHEAIHCDRVGGRYEEVAATAFDTFFWIFMLLVEPELASRGTALAREYNVDAIAMINSGRAVPESVGILRSPGVTQALPATTSQVSSFGDLVASAYPSITYNESPDEPVAQAYVAILADAAEMGAGSAFDLVYLDELLARAMAVQALTSSMSALRVIPQ